MQYTIIDMGMPDGHVTCVPLVYIYRYSKEILLDPKVTKPMKSKNITSQLEIVNIVIVID